jgi:SpoVK/Ycf46/Vps4 family AAA+-type ATPase
MLQYNKKRNINELTNNNIICSKKTKINNKKNKEQEKEKDEEKKTNEELSKILFILFNQSPNNSSDDPPNNSSDDPPKNPPKNSLKKTNICPNLLCNHKTLKEDSTEILFNKIDKINSIYDLIELGKSYHCKKNTEYKGLNLRILCNLVMPLTELDNMIGMDDVKSKILDQILYFIRGIHNMSSKCEKCKECIFNLPCVKNQNDMLHTVITGPPGVGKTELGKILGKVYKAMEILSSDKFKVVGRSDMVAAYLGQTAIKTQKLIDQCKGGVLFIDEAYALGNTESNDSFSKECIDTLNQNLSERRDFLCIIAGYKEALDTCFFKYNEGLRRRFTFRYDLKKYTHLQLKQIFELKVKNGGFEIDYNKNNNKEDKEIIINLFKKKYNYFPNNAGDIETLFLNCKISHSRNISNFSVENKNLLTNQDILDGFDNFIKEREYKNKSNSLLIY